MRVSAGFLQYKVMALIAALTAVAIPGLPAQQTQTAAPGPVALPSRVAEVTVYADRALVVRRAEIQPAAGTTTFAIADLPAAADPASIQVSGKGAFTIRDVRVASRQKTRDVSAQVKGFEDQRRAFEAKLAAAADRVKEAESERVFLTDLAKRLTGNAGASESLPLDVPSWTRMLDFHRDRHAAANQALRDAKTEVQALQAEIDRINREIKALGSGGRLSVLEAEVTVEAVAAGRGSLDLSYLVAGPSWRPDYVLRADSEAASLAVNYRALVRQNTGEDWENAAIRLSTARPQVGGSLPSLSPWYIDVYRPAPVYRESAGAARKSMAPPAPAAMAAESAAEPEEELRAADFVASSAVSGATAVTFAIPGATSISSDNRDRTVMIAVLSLPVTYSWAAVPKLSSFAYFRAEAKNDSDFPFLPGETHVYVDGGYVADAAMESVAPGQSFSTDLGVDEAVTVERKLVRKFDETSGLIAKKSKTTWEYAITAKNDKKRAIELSVADQAPISSNEQILVKIIAPTAGKDTDFVRNEGEESFTWKLTLGPGQAARLPLAFSVEYPKGTPVTGLE